MAFQHNLSRADNNLSTDFTAVYTLVVSTEVLPQPVYQAPSEEGGDPILVTKHTIRFSTKTFANQSARNTGKGAIAEHSYIEPYPLTSSADNVVAFCYTWLAANVDMFADATSI